MNMFRQMLRLHWKTGRWAISAMTLLCLGIPLFVLRMMSASMPDPYFPESAYMMWRQQEFLGVYPLLALVIGTAAGLAAWSWDHQVKHVYSLSLPVSRGRYALLKMASGFVILLIPIAGLVAGVLVGLATLNLPTGLNAYPVSFVARFFFAALITYAATFALASTTVRTTAFILVGGLVVLVFGTIAAEFYADVMNTAVTSPAEFIYNGLLHWPGPFSVFGGSWMLIDA